MAEIRHLGSWRQNAKTRFSQKLSSLELWCLLTTYSKLCNLNWAFQRTLITGSIQSKMAEIRYLENRHDVIFCAEGGPIWIKFRRLYRMTCWLRWYVEMETRCRIPIWRKFGRIQWHVIPEPRITLQGAATWWIHCHDSKATCHIAGCKNSIRHIENRFLPHFIIFVFLMQFRLWRAAAFVSSPIHLF